MSLNHCMNQNAMHPTWLISIGSVQPKIECEQKISMAYMIHFGVLEISWESAHY